MAEEMTPSSYSDGGPPIDVTPGMQDGLSTVGRQILKDFYPDASPEQLDAAAEILQPVQEKVLATGEVDFEATKIAGQAIRKILSPEGRPGACAVARSSEDLDHLHAPTDDEYRQYHERYHDDDGTPPALRTAYPPGSSACLPDRIKRY